MVFPMKSKKGLELSINFVVMLIIALAVFGFGISFAFRFLSLGEDIKGEISDQSQKQIRDLLISRGERVTVPYQTLTVESGKTGLAAVGVFNILDGDQRFKLRVSLINYVKPGARQPESNINLNAMIKVSGGPPTGQPPAHPLVSQSNDPQAVIFTKEQSVQLIKEQDVYVFSVPISSRGALKGTYNLMAEVFKDDGNEYAQPMQLVVIVQ